MKNYETAYYEPELADNNSFEQWRDAGEKDALTRAGERVKTLLDNYQPPAIDPGVDEALKSYIQQQKSSRPDAWH